MSLRLSRNSFHRAFGLGRTTRTLRTQRWLRRLLTLRLSPPPRPSRPCNKTLEPFQKSMGGIRASWNPHQNHQISSSSIDSMPIQTAWWTGLQLIGPREFSKVLLAFANHPSSWCILSSSLIDSEESNLLYNNLYQNVCSTRLIPRPILRVPEKQKETKLSCLRVDHAPIHLQRQRNESEIHWNTVQHL